MRTGPPLVGIDEFGIVVGERGSCTPWGAAPGSGVAPRQSLVWHTGAALTRPERKIPRPLRPPTPWSNRTRRHPAALRYGSRVASSWQTDGAAARGARGARGIRGAGVPGKRSSRRSMAAPRCWWSRPTRTMRRSAAPGLCSAWRTPAGASASCGSRAAMPRSSDLLVVERSLLGGAVEAARPRRAAHARGACRRRAPRRARPRGNSCSATRTAASGY